MRAHHEALAVPPVFVDALQKLGDPGLDLWNCHFDADVLSNVRMNDDDVAGTSCSCESLSDHGSV